MFQLYKQIKLNENEKDFYIVKFVEIETISWMKLEFKLISVLISFLKLIYLI
jgi:hypothetical protein